MADCPDVNEASFTERLYAKVGNDVEIIAKHKADDTYPVVSAASIVAKVTRDRMLVEYDKIYPEFQFAKNKGYGTKDHIEALRKYGTTTIHRRSFIKNYVEEGTI